jgi:Glycosyl hydrolase family 20, domain 2
MRQIERCLFSLLLSLFICSNTSHAEDEHSALWKAGITLIPYPHSVVLEGDDFVLDEKIFIRTDKRASQDEIFAAEELRQQLRDRWGINSQIAVKPERKEIVLTCKKAPSERGEQGYKIVPLIQGLGHVSYILKHPEFNISGKLNQTTGVSAL